MERRNLARSGKSFQLSDGRRIRQSIAMWLDAREYPIEMKYSDNPCGSWTAAQYIENRLEQYIEWYDKKAVRMKAIYLQMQAASVVGAAIVPVLLNFTATGPMADFWRYLNTAISLGVVILVSLESVFHYREQWKNYRSTEQYLSREKFLFLAGEGPYQGMQQKDAYILLVSRVEDAIASENASTLNVMTVAPQKHKDNSATK